MKHYLYLSKSKIEMLGSQIRSRGFSNIVKGLSLKLGPMSIELKGKDQKEQSIYEKCFAIEHHLRERSLIGTMAMPKDWFEGVVNAQCFNLEPNTNVVFFFAALPNTRLALGGQSSHLVGAVEKRVLKSSLSFLPDLLNSLELLTKINPLTERMLSCDLNSDLPSLKIAPSDFLSSGVTQGELAWDAIIREFARRRKPPQQRIQFLARRLSTVDHQGIQTILATPLYIALADQTYSE
jgi:hypothetical protein